jgi:hypothetical protein
MGNGLCMTIAILLFVTIAPLLFLGMFVLSGRLDLRIAERILDWTIAALAIQWRRGSVLKCRRRRSTGRRRRLVRAWFRSPDALDRGDRAGPCRLTAHRAWSGGVDRFDPDRRELAPGIHMSGADDRSPRLQRRWLGCSYSLLSCLRQGWWLS